MNDLRYFQATRSLRRARMLMYAFWASAVALLTLAVWAEQGELPVGMTAFLLAGFAPIVLWVEKVVLRSGLEEIEDGYVYHDSTGAKPIPFSRVDRFEAGRRLLRRGRPSVYLIDGSGRSMQVLGLVQGRPTEWDGGETCDIVGLLNERHEMRRSRRDGNHPE